VSRRGLELGALALGTAAAVALWLAFPVEPTFDSMWSLVWGREVWAGGLPSFDAYRAPTEHPLWVVVSVVLVPLGGDAAPRAMTLLGALSLVGMLAGLYRLGRATFGVAAGAVAVVLVVSRLDFGFWALFGYVDVPYLALLVWAAALEAERSRRGGAVWVLLALAGLLRPEAWLVSGVYAAWVAWPRRGRTSAWMRAGAYAAVPVVLWGLTDLLVTGDPAFSFSMSTDHAAELGRSRGLLVLPRSTASSALEVVKAPVLALAAAGFAAALVLRPRVAPRVPFAMLLFGLAGFLVVSATGFSVIPRYFATPGVLLALLAAFALAGWTTIARGRARSAWSVAALTAIVLGGALQAARLNPSKVTDDLRYREGVTTALRAALAGPAARAGRRCGPTSVPNHLLQPYALWDLDVPVTAVVARTDAEHGQPGRGVALLTLTSRLDHHPAFGSLNPRVQDPTTVLGPPKGFEPAASAPLLATYVRCA
jgi:hypothetical protein